MEEVKIDVPLINVDFHFEALIDSAYVHAGFYKIEHIEDRNEKGFRSQNTKFSHGNGALKIRDRWILIK